MKAQILIQAEPDGSHAIVYTNFIDSATYETMVDFAKLVVTDPTLGSAIEDAQKFKEVR